MSAAATGNETAPASACDIGMRGLHSDGGGGEGRNATACGGGAADDAEAPVAPGPLAYAANFAIARQRRAVAASAAAEAQRIHTEILEFKTRFDAITAKLEEKRDNATSVVKKGKATAELNAHLSGARARRKKITALDPEKLHVLEIKQGAALRKQKRFARAARQALKAAVLLRDVADEGLRLANDAEAPVAPAFEGPLAQPAVRGQVSTLAFTNPDGSPCDLLKNATSIKADGAGGLYVARGSAIYRATAERVVSVFAGDPDEAGDRDGVGASARFGQGGLGLALDARGRRLWVTDPSNDKIKRVDLATRQVTSAAGDGERGDIDGAGAAARLHGPVGPTLTPDGARLFFADFGSHKIKCFEAATGAVATLAGDGERGDRDGVGAAARFYEPSGVVCLRGEELLVADSGNDKLRRVDLATAAVTTLAWPTSAVPPSTFVADMGKTYAADAAHSPRARSRSSSPAAS